jgi:hypothetical protein
MLVRQSVRQVLETGRSQTRSTSDSPMHSAGAGGPPRLRGPPAPNQHSCYGV